MKKIIITILLIWSLSGYGQKVLLEAGERRDIADTSDVKGTTAFAWWGDSFTANGTAPIVLGRLMGLFPFNGGVGGETSGQIKARFISDTVKWDWPTLIWSGRNNSGDSATVVSDIQEMVSKLGHSKYLIISVFNAGGEPSGSSPYVNIQKINSALSGLYGGKFVDARSYIVSQYNPSDPADVYNFGRDETPKSLRATNDSLHLNETGYKKVAQYIYDNYRDTLVSTGSKITTISTNKISGAPLYAQGLFIEPGKNVPAIQFFNNKWQPNNAPSVIDLKVTTSSIYFGLLSGDQADEDLDNYGIGYNTLPKITGAGSYRNIAIGSNALSSATTNSNQNIAIGHNAGNSITASGSSGVYIGYNAGSNSSQKVNCSNCIAIGGYSNVYANRNHQAVFGGESIAETQLKGQVGINMGMAAPKSNAQLQINSTTKGFVMPRMTSSQRSSISVTSADSALSVFDLDSMAVMTYNGSAWKRVRYTSDMQLVAPTANSGDSSTSISTTAFVDKIKDSILSLTSSGRYTPTIAGVQNVASVGTVYSAHYSRNRDEIEINGVVLITPTSGAATTIISISLPNGWQYASASFGEAEGHVSVNDITTRGQAGFVSTYSNTLVQAVFTSLTTGQNDVHYSFTITKSN